MNTQLEVLTTERPQDKPSTRRAPCANGKHPESLSARREKLHRKEKEAMGVYFARHDFLVADGVSPERPRESVALVFANQGSTVNIVVRNTLDWIRGSPDSGPFTITWFTPSALVPATLRRSRETIVAASNNGGEPGNEEPDPWSASRIFLFPGEIDPAREVVQGPEAVKFAKGFKQLFNCSLLGATAFDLDTGDVYFHYSHEVPLQVACAKLWDLYTVLHRPRES